MDEIEWAGAWWEVHELPPAAASSVSRLASGDAAGQLSAVLEVAEFAGVNPDEIVEATWTSDEEVDVVDFAAAVLKVGTGRPWRSTVGLSRSIVTQWSTVRGRLIQQGIADPLRDLPSLTALCDVFEVMVLDGMDKQEDRDKFMRQMYRDETTADKNTPPPGWEDGAEGLEDLFG